MTTQRNEWIVVTVTDIRGGKVRLGFDAPPAVIVYREEIQDRIDRGDRRP